jgi:CRISPR system Cascade subunit CasE
MTMHAVPHAGAYLTRARLTRDASRLAPLLIENSGQTHRLIWSMFPRELQDRPFLYRDTGDGQFVVLSSIEPTGSGLFEIESRPFAPALEIGDRLQFSLRANPVVTKGRDRHDVIMHAIHGIAARERYLHRDEAVQTAGSAWLRRQGELAGFEVIDVTIDGYRQERGRPVYAQAEFTGVLEVTDPAAFVQRLAVGFGRARAFGLGLMLVKRA